jgi:hypothetical protein
MTNDDIVKNDLVAEIRMFSDVDDHDYNEDFFRMKHPGMLPWPKGGVKTEFSAWNRSQLTKHFMKVAPHAKAILEIGVHRNGEDSSTWCFLNYKNKDTFYFGIDIVDKSFLDDHENNIYTLQENSSYTEKIMKVIRATGVEKFDFIFIDGKHSINQVLDDWKFTEYLAEGGIVGFHDTNCHPGPMLFVDHLDPEKYNVEKCCKTWLVDYGISFVSRK